MMFVPRYFFEKFMSLLEVQHALSVRQTEDSLQRVLDAKNSEVKAVIAAKDEQILFLTTALAEQRELVGHERQRAEAAVDLLLTRDSGTGPIRNADLIRDAAEREALADLPAAGVPRPADRQNEFAKIMAQVSSVLTDVDDDPGSGAQRDTVATVGGVDLK